METENDVMWNPDAFMQIGDFVASTFLMSGVALLGISIFILVQIRSVPQQWKLAVLLATMVPLMASFFTFFRTNYWISTQTNPIEFRFFDWFATVPLMSIVFYYLLRPLGARKFILIGLGLSALCMLGFGYIGEALYPENSVMWGILGSIGFGGIIGIIMGAGYPKIFKEGVHPVHRTGYVALSILLPIGWSVYPIGYLSVPGNLLEGVLGPETVAVMYNLADIFNKGGLALGTAYIAAKTGDYYSEQSNNVAGRNRKRPRPQEVEPDPIDMESEALDHHQIEIKRIQSISEETKRLDN